MIGSDGSGNRRGWLIPNGVRAIQVAARIRKRGDKPVRLLHVGRLERQKNQRLLLEAVSMIERDFSLTIVGSGQLRSGGRGYRRRRSQGSGIGWHFRVSGEQRGCAGMRGD